MNNYAVTTKKKAEKRLPERVKNPPLKGMAGHPIELDTIGLVDDEQPRYGQPRYLVLGAVPCGERVRLAVVAVPDVTSDGEIVGQVYRVELPATRAIEPGLVIESYEAEEHERFRAAWQTWDESGRKVRCPDKDRADTEGRIGILLDEISKSKANIERLKEETKDAKAGLESEQSDLQLSAAWLAGELEFAR